MTPPRRRVVLHRSVCRDAPAPWVPPLLATDRHHRSEAVAVAPPPDATTGTRPFPPPGTWDEITPETCGDCGAPVDARRTTAAWPPVPPTATAAAEFLAGLGGRVVVRVAGADDPPPTDDRGPAGLHQWGSAQRAAPRGDWHLAAVPAGESASGAWHRRPGGGVDGGRVDGGAGAATGGGGGGGAGGGDAGDTGGADGARDGDATDDAGGAGHGPAAGGATTTDGWAVPAHSAELSVAALSVDAAPVRAATGRPPGAVPARLAVGGPFGAAPDDAPARRLVGVPTVGSDAAATDDGDPAGHAPVAERCPALRTQADGDVAALLEALGGPPVDADDTALPTHPR